MIKSVVCTSKDQKSSLFDVISPVKLHSHDIFSLRWLTMNSFERLFCKMFQDVFPCFNLSATLLIKNHQMDFFYF